MNKGDESPRRGTGMIRQDANGARHAVPLGTRGLRACHRVITTDVRNQGRGDSGPAGLLYPYILLFFFAEVRSGPGISHSENYQKAPSCTKQTKTYHFEFVNQPGINLRL